MPDRLLHARQGVSLSISAMMQNTLSRLPQICLRELGVLRVMLLITTAAVIALVPAAHTPAGYEGWAMITTLVAPALAPIIFMGWLFDSLMCLVVRSSASAPGRLRLRRIVWTDLTAATLLALDTAPYLATIGR